MKGKNAIKNAKEYNKKARKKYAEKTTRILADLDTDLVIKLKEKLNSENKTLASFLREKIEEYLES